MGTFVFVHGAWHGGEVWKDVIKELRDVGHEASAITLTGLGERKHLFCDLIDLQTHIQDVVAHIDTQGFDRVTLVGWSYGGMVIAGVLSRITQRVRRMVYVDAFFPDDGKCLIDYVSKDGRDYIDEFKKKNQAVPPPPFEVFGMRDAKWIEFLKARISPQPWKTFYQPVRTYSRAAEIPTSYVYCRYEQTPFTDFYKTLKKEQLVKVFDIETNHYCMLTHPQRLTKILLG